MGLERILPKLALIGFLAFNGCKLEAPNEITVKNEPRGEIVGTVTWDFNGDGIYTGASGASIERFNPGGGPPDVRNAGVNGGYSYHDVPIGTYVMRAMKITYSPYTVWEEWADATVTKGNVSTINFMLKKK